MARLASPGLNPWLRGHRSHSFDKWLRLPQKIAFLKNVLQSANTIVSFYTTLYTQTIFFQYKRIANERKVTELSKHKQDSINFYFETVEVNRFQIVLPKFCWTRQQIAFHIKLLISSLTPVSYKHAIYGKLIMHADTYSYVLCFTENQY